MRRRRPAVGRVGGSGHQNGRRFVHCRQAFGGRLVEDGEVEGKSAAGAGIAPQSYLPAEEGGNLAADREAEARAAKAAARVHLRLLEGLEDHTMLVG